MSRRKQEKPQPRKIFVKEDATELSQDILTCGVCRRDFPLCEIVRFIQHKVNICNKENNCLNKLFGIPPEDSDSEDDSLQTVPHKKPSPLLQRPASTSDADHVSSSSTLKNAFAKDTSAKDNSEPCTYICSTCKQSHTSAWDLLQHVQNQHGLDLYVESTSNQVVRSNTEETDSKVTTEPSAPRAPLLERQLDHAGPLILRSSSQEPRLDLFSLSSAAVNLSAPTSPPPLIEMHHLGDSSPQNETNFEPKLDFCSQRLRELAGATSLNALVSSASKLLQPNFKVVVKDDLNGSLTNNNEHNQMESATTPHTPPPQLPQSSASSITSESENPISPRPNPKECEFCGKSFRFMSNLIVHRRSHTGEKPFKCHICNHACTQASKLKRHMKTHRRRKKIDDEFPVNRHVNGTANSDTDKTNKIHDGHTNGEADYNSDDQKSRLRSRYAIEDDEEEIDVEDDDDEDDDDDADIYKKLTVDLGPDDGMMAEDLSKKSMKNGTSENNGIRKEGRMDNDNKSIMRHSLLSEVMEKIGLANIQQYSEAYKQALKESSIIKHEHPHSDGSTSNDGSHYPERPSREGTRSAGPLSFTPNILSAFDQSMGLKRLKMEDNWREKDDNLYAGLWIPSTHSMSSYKDLFSADGSDRRKSKTESALNSISPSSARSSSPRPGPSNSLCLIGSFKPKEQRRNDTCEYCGKIFKNCSNLTVHRRSHTGEKPYKCELCTYACAQSSKLTRHMKTHGRMGKDVYRCRFCDMPFSVPSTLEKHMRKCVVSQSGGSSYLLSERESDSKEMIT